MSWICPDCREKNDDEAKYCWRCRTPNTNHPEIVAEKQREDAEKQKEKERIKAEKQQHEAHLQALSSIMMTSGYNFEGYEIEQYEGIIVSESFPQLFSSGSTNDVIHRRCKVLESLKEKASVLKCNGIIGVKLEYVYISYRDIAAFTEKDATLAQLPNHFGIIGSGTAVKVKKK